MWPAKRFILSVCGVVQLHYHHTHTLRDREIGRFVSHTFITIITVIVVFVWYDRPPKPIKCYVVSAFPYWYSFGEAANQFNVQTDCMQMCDECVIRFWFYFSVFAFYLLLDE